MKQRTLAAQNGFERYGKKTRRAEFLRPRILRRLVPSDSLPFLAVPTGRAVTGQRSEFALGRPQPQVDSHEGDLLCIVDRPESVDCGTGPKDNSRDAKRRVFSTAGGGWNRGFRHTRDGRLQTSHKDCWPGIASCLHVIRPECELPLNPPSEAKLPRYGATTQ
jgi:hypothetical protein